MENETPDFPTQPERVAGDYQSIPCEISGNTVIIPPITVRLRDTCAACEKPIGVADDQCTGWHPAFRCDCGYEEQSERAVTYQRCPTCGAINRRIIERDITLNAEIVYNDILDAEVVE